jgi:hypothetical protein
MNSQRKELIALATFMPEPALWTAYIVLKTVREIYDAGGAGHDEAAPQQSEPTNVIDIRSGRRSQAEPASAKQDDEVADAVKAVLSVQIDEARSRRIAEGQERLERLSGQISAAAAKGHSTEIAEELFLTFLQSLNLMQTFDRAVPPETASAI